MMSKVDAKVVLLGKSYVGKTCMVNRYVHARFDENIPYQNTIGAAFGCKKETVGQKPIILGIWDTAGHERYESMTRMYYRGASACILCYDITDKNSFDRVRFWAGELRSTEQECRIYLCGTKLDMAVDNPNRREVTENMAKPLARDFGSELYETSSKTGENIEALFKKIASDIMEQKEEKARQQRELMAETVHVNNSQHKNPCGCLS